MHIKNNKGKFIKIFTEIILIVMKISLSDESISDFKHYFYFSNSTQWSYIIHIILKSQKKKKGFKKVKRGRIYLKAKSFLMDGHLYFRKKLQHGNLLVIYFSCSIVSHKPFNRRPKFPILWVSSSKSNYLFWFTIKQHI